MTNPEFSDVVSLDGVASTKNPGLPLSLYLQLLVLPLK